jgi:hypothetical protein
MTRIARRPSWLIPAKPALRPPGLADAISLFDGNDLSRWEAPGDWKVLDGSLVSGNTHFATKDSFGSVQLHVEWMAPAGFDGPWYNRGNNGVLLMGLFEIQIFDSFNEKIYPTGRAALSTGRRPRLLMRPGLRGEWQTYDIVFTAPKFEGEKLIAPARVTVFQNGVLIQFNEEIHGDTGHRIVPEYKRHVSQGPLVLGGHGCPVRFRDIWLRRLA